MDACLRRQAVGEKWQLNCNVRDKFDTNKNCRSANDPIADIVLECEASQMRPTTIIVLLFALTGCASSQKDSQAALMDDIESSIRLPPGARPLENYARYYTMNEGFVQGAYSTEVEAPRPSDYGCEVVGPDGSSKLVACRPPADARPGERRWVKFEDYPAVAGEDCTAIQLEFDPRTRKFTYLECADPLH